ncbi:hypothetical protein SAMN05216410_0660 [Sanguibacter gelidistatuariae]|uniref:CBU-0592-like domain-containing protein n=1 Tax=Sanguibacter gelidistatuariae TaxID=1814289 RepID=A0A1G6H2D4_9MICO|nr:hypothetical protein [Sanguibacter gelidistatuariae]SDB88314.1 hypothetical protein SAMN05216410_0660 [Sanguibacter gelidistatuariae]
MSTAVQLAVTLAGWTGALSTVFAYGMVTAKRISPDSLVFQGLNIVGAFLLSISASTYGAWPSAVVNVIWVAIGVFALRAIWLHRTRMSVPLIDGVSAHEAAPKPVACDATPDHAQSHDAASHTTQRNSAQRTPVAA